MVVTDNFNRADGGLGANWTTASGFSALAIVSNACKGGTGGAHNVGVYTASGTASANQYVQFKVTATGSSLGPVLRSNGAGTFYVCYYPAVTGGNPQIYKWISGSPTLIISGSPITPAVNDVVYFEAVGNALTFKINGVVRASATDGAITGSGYTGLNLFDNIGAVDDFEGGGVGEVSVSLTGVAADPQIGVGTVEIGSVPVEPPVSPGGGTGAGRPARTGMRLRPTEDKAVYLKGVAASPKVGQVMVLHEMQRAYEAYSAPIRRAQAQKPAEMPPGMRRLFKKVEKPVPPAVFVYQVGLPKLKSAVGTMTVKAFYEDIDEETIAMIDLL